MHLFEKDFWNEYEELVVNKPTLKQAVQALLGRVKQPFVRATGQPVLRRGGPKAYLKPTLRRLSAEQASLILIGHAGVGDQGAKELMDVAFKMTSTPKIVPLEQSRRRDF